MLWLKSWMEIRIRFVLTILLGVYIVYLILGIAPAQVAEKFPALSAPDLGVKLWKVFLIAFGGAVLPISAKVLAGSGINAQTSMGMSTGFHGSMSFLLSMPVSRRHLLATRAALGAALLLLVGIATFTATAALAPAANVDFSKIGIWQSFPNTLLVSLFFYCLAVFLSTFLDEFWSGTIGLLILGACAGLSVSAPETTLDLLSYLFHPAPLLPLSQTLLLLAASGGLLAAAVRIVDLKEY
jgi:hypothetical protein